LKRIEKPRYRNNSSILPNLVDERTSLNHEHVDCDKGKGNPLGGGMKPIKLFCIIVIFLSYPISVLGSDSYDNVISDATISIVKELKYMNQLNGKTIAVCGFHDVNSGEGCRPLSVSLANQIDSKINEIKNLLDVSFRTVPRHALDSIETEYLISKGHGDRDIFSLLRASDILITGMWQDQGDSLKLTIKAVAIKNDDIDQLSAVSKEIDKKTIPQNLLLSCLRKYVELKPNASHTLVTRQHEGWVPNGIKYNSILLHTKGPGSDILAGYLKKQASSGDLTIYEQKDAPTITPAYRLKINVDMGSPQRLNAYGVYCWYVKASMKLSAKSTGKDITLHLRDVPDVDTRIYGKSLDQAIRSQGSNSFPEKIAKPFIRDFMLKLDLFLAPR